MQRLHALAGARRPHRRAAAPVQARPRAPARRRRWPTSASPTSTASTSTFFPGNLGGDLGLGRGKSHFHRALQFLDRLPADAGQTDLARSLRAFGQVTKRRGLVLILSDFFDPAGYEEALSYLLYQRFEIQLIQLLDPAELNPRLRGDLRLTDAETRQVYEVTANESLVRAYEREIGSFLAGLETVLPATADRLPARGDGRAVRGFRPADAADRGRTGPMTLLNPLALAFAALVPLIVVLYLLKLRRQPAQVSTLMFWQRVTADNRRRALFQRLRQILSLLLHLLIFALLLFALARPELRVVPGHGGGSFHGRHPRRPRPDAGARGRTAARALPRPAASRRVTCAALRPRQPVALLVDDGRPARGRRADRRGTRAARWPRYHPAHRRGRADRGRRDARRPNCSPRVPAGGGSCW